MKLQKFILYSEASYKLLCLWVPVFLLLGIFIQIQSSTGLIEGIEMKVWLWFFVAFSPFFFLLFAGFGIKKQSGKTLPFSVYRSQFWGTTFYLLLILLVFLFSRKSIDANDFGLDIYYKKSLWILLPFNFILTFIFISSLFFNDELSGQEVFNMANEKIQISRKAHLVHRETCLNNISEGDISAALKETTNWFRKSGKRSYEDVILLEGRFNQLQQEINRNTISVQEAEIRRNKISVALIELIQKIDD